jgi:hypothetical protein
MSFLYCIAAYPSLLMTFTLLDPLKTSTSGLHQRLLICLFYLKGLTLNLNDYFSIRPEFMKFIIIIIIIIIIICDSTHWFAVSSFRSFWDGARSAHADIRSLTYIIGL